MHAVPAEATEEPNAMGDWTIDELHRLPDDGNRYELVGGELFVTPPPSVGHQVVSATLFRVLDAYVREQGLGVVVYAPNQLLLANEKEETQPDLMVIPGAMAELRDKEWKALPRPILVVEILSRTTGRRDKGAKRDLYVRERIPAYWIVDKEYRSIRVIRPEHEDVISSDSFEWYPAGANAPLVIDVAGVFREALGPS